MSQLSIIVPLAIVFAVILFWLLRPRRHPADEDRLPIDGGITRSLPNHYRYFPLIRQALSAGDNQYLLEVAPPHVAHQVLRERRAVARRFLRGLLEDYSSLERLGRMVASLSQVVSRQQE